MEGGFHQRLRSRVYHTKPSIGLLPGEGRAACRLSLLSACFSHWAWLCRGSGSLLWFLGSIFVTHVRLGDVGWVWGSLAARDFILNFHRSNTLSRDRDLWLGYLIACFPDNHIWWLLIVHICTRFCWFRVISLVVSRRGIFNWFALLVCLFTRYEYLLPTLVLVVWNSGFIVRILKLYFIFMPHIIYSIIPW